MAISPAYDAPRIPSNATLKICALVGSPTCPLTHRLPWLPVATERIQYIHSQKREKISAVSSISTKVSILTLPTSHQQVLYVQRQQEGNYKQVKKKQAAADEDFLPCLVNLG